MVFFGNMSKETEWIVNDRIKVNYYVCLQKKRNEKRPADIMSSIHSARHRNESMNMSFEPPSKDIQFAEGGNLLSCKSVNSEEDETNSVIKVFIS